VLTGTHRWLARARLWRLILSQNTQGYWDASTTTAFALEARDAKETQCLPSTLFDRILGLLGGVAEIVATVDVEDGGRHEDDASAIDDIVADVEETRHSRRITTDAQHNAAQDEGEPPPSTPRSLAAHPSLARRSVSMATAAALHDCPLSFCVNGIKRSVPRALTRLRGIEEPSSAINVERVWATMCCIATLERQNCSWIWGDGDIYEEAERTIVDGASTAGVARSSASRRRRPAVV
jgi:hypothetical protein